MITRQAYENYKHSISCAYHSLSLLPQVSREQLGFPSFNQIDGRSSQDVIAFCIESIKNRIKRLDPGLLSGFLETPKSRTIFFNNRKFVIPLLNSQAVEWYGASSIFNFDFLIESFLGMHQDARTIYDIGGHQGIWAAYYSMLCGPTGRVFSFEPSIINIECSSLLFMINNLTNIVNIAFGIGSESVILEKKNSQALIDFVDHNIGLIRFDQIYWERPDFVKIDIEGFEYELIKSFPNLFDFCPNVHLELHIPHLQNRGLDYREIYEAIPFEKVKVINYQNGYLREVVLADNLDGFCSLLVTAR